jgi:hypothetical protein
MKDYLSIFDEVPLLAGLTLRQRVILKNNSAFVEYKKGQLIYKEGSDPGLSIVSCAAGSRYRRRTGTAARRFWNTCIGVGISVLFHV